MEIIKLPDGEQAPPDTDCISIWKTAAGHVLNCSVLFQCGDDEEAESVSMMDSPPFATREEAESVGLAWAAEHCVETIYVTTTPYEAAS